MAPSFPNMLRSLAPCVLAHRPIAIFRFFEGAGVRGLRQCMLLFMEDCQEYQSGCVVWQHFSSVFVGFSDMQTEFAT